jgi:hypothetical protein
MSVAAARRPLSYRPGIETRPPAQSWRPLLAVPADPLQPMLDLEGASDVQASARGVTWMATPPADLPDAVAWSAKLAQLLVETLQGLRPIGQLNRWVDERVLAAITIHRRQRRTNRTQARPTRPAVLRSVHVQFPAELVAEVAAHLVLNGRSIALAFRLEAFYGRWLGTAVEFGPLDQECGPRARSRELRD